MNKIKLDNSIIENIKSLTDINNHIEARLVLSLNLKRKDLFECYSSITQLQNYFGHLPFGLEEVQDKLDLSLFKSTKNTFSNFKKIENAF